MKLLNFSTLFPEKGDPRHPPLWFWRALLWTAIALFLGLFAWDAIGKLGDVIAVLAISFFLAIALEPAVDFFEKHGINRKIATLACIFVALGLIIAFFILFGSIFVNQISELLNNAPGIYNDVRSWLNTSFGIIIPEGGTMLQQLLGQYANEISHQAVSLSMGVFTGALSVLTIILVMYYMCAEGDKMRHTIASWFPQDKQRELIRILTIMQVKVGGFLGSRLILAIISIVFTSTFLYFMNLPYWLPIGVFMGLISQFIPTVGVYIGGALPILVAFTSGGLWSGVIVTIVIIVYQNLENMLIMPIVSQEALDLNAAVAFISVIAFGYIWGPLGAFMALPITAMIVTLFKLSGQKYDVIDIDEVEAKQKEQTKQMRAKK